MVQQLTADRMQRSSNGRLWVRPPVRVCFLIDRLRVAGTESQLLRLIEGLDRTRVVPYLCLLDGNDEVSRALEPKDCEVLPLGVRSLHRPATVVQAWKFVRFLRMNRIDILQVFFPDSTYFGVPLARLAGVRRVIATRRNLGYWMTRRDRWLARLYRRLIDVTVANCEACRQAVIEQEGISPNAVTVLENGIDLEPFLAIPPVKPCLNGRPRCVGMVANLRPVKGIDVFIRAAALVAASHPNVVFQIAGTGDEASARRLATECGIADRLQLLGRVDDIPAFLGGLDVAVLASHSEGLSNALLEYMAAARPIVATSVGGNREVIEDGIHGLLVPPNDLESLAQAVLRLIRAPEYAMTLGESARKHAERTFAQEIMVQRLEHLYRALAKSATARR